MNEEEYRELLKKEQSTLKKLHNKIYRKKIPVVIAYEGWDAAGKGGNIRRVAEALDPRGYEVVPIAAPTADELAHQHLWRFWTKAAQGWAYHHLRPHLVWEAYGGAHRGLRL